MKRIISVILCIAFVCLCFTGCGENGSTASPSGKKGNSYSSGIHHAEIKIVNYGTVKLELDADTAPITVQNFCELADSGFYDGLTFHRLMQGFVLQGGDPNHNGSGGSEKKIKGEFALNGVKNDIAHDRGVISMARASNDYNSASSQFFIVLEDSASNHQSLDGQYASFGHVTSGMEIIDKICAETPVADYFGGSIDFQYQPVIKYIRVID